MKHILVVDDDPSILCATAEVLQAQGHKVSLAHDGKEATDKLEQNHIDVILLDIFMPEKDGFETIADIRRNYRDVRIIAMTGYDEGRFDALEYALSLGANLALSKPFSADQLKDALRVVLDKG